MPWWLLWRRKVQGADVARLEAWEPGGPSMAGGNFLGVRLPRQNLRGIDLSNANLNEADLRKAELIKAYFTASKINHANLSQAKLKFADLRNAELVGTNLREADLSWANLSGIVTQPDIPEDLQTTEVHAVTTDFSHAKLQNTNFTVADLQGADLSEADLDQARLRSATLNHANLYRARLWGADLRNAELVGTNLREADLRRADLSGIVTQPDVPEDMKTTEANARTTDFRGANLQSVNLSGADLRRADLGEVNLEYAYYSDQTQWPAGFQVASSGATWVNPDQILDPQHAISVPGHGALPMGAIPPGTFWMGAADNDNEAHDQERPRHEVVLTHGFLIGRTPVTQQLYKVIMGTNPSYHNPFYTPPVECVSWFDAVRFCNKLSKACGLDEAYIIGEGDKPHVSCRFDVRGFRLPTEAEWEYAAKAGQTHKYSGSDNPDTVAWHLGNSSRKTHSVALKRPNAWGLYDMSGNVYEWCWDRSDEDEYTRRVTLSAHKGTPVNDPTGAETGIYRVLRGGACDSVAELQRVSARGLFKPERKSKSFGFRVVLSTPSRT